MDRVIYSIDRLGRVVVFANQNGSFGFREEVFSSEPSEDVWTPRCAPRTHCATEEIAMAEATGRVAWLSSEALLWEDQR